MRKRAVRQVDPRITVIAILAMLAVVQWAWWKGLVWHPKYGVVPRPDVASRAATMLTLTGLDNVYVETVAGDPEPGDADGLGRVARFDGPCGLVLDKAGNVIVADSRNHRIRKIAPDGRTTTLAGSTAGHEDGPLEGARFNAPSSVDVGPDGTIYVADSGNRCIRAIKDGQVRTSGIPNSQGVPIGIFAGTGGPIPFLASPGSMALTTGQELLGSGGLSLTRVTVSGGGGIELHNPVAMARSPSGAYFLSDARHCALFQVRGGSAEVVAGAAQKDRLVGGFRDGTGNRCGFGIISGIASDGKGHLYVSDLDNNAIRKVTLPQ